MAMPGLYVLPSNGLPAESSSALESISSDRVLRDRCINSQYESSQRSTTCDFKYDIGDSPKENAHAQTFSAYHRATANSRASGLELVRYDPLQGLSWTIQHRPPIDEIEYAYLVNRLHQCGPYMKYRDGAGKEQKSSDLQKWPDPLEAVFWRAVLYWKPMKRGKLPTGDRGGRPPPEADKTKKAFGRNELIAIFIDDWFGLEPETNVKEEKERPRKRVSSHLQVLKGYFINDPYVLGHLGKEHYPLLPRPGASLHLSRRQNILQRACIGSRIRGPSRGLVQQRPLHQPFNVLLSQANTGYSTFMQPKEFKMYIQYPNCRSQDTKHKCTSDGQECTFEIIHDITKSQRTSGVTPTLLDEHPAWQTKLPHLETMLTGDGSDCNILLAESSLSLTTDCLPEKIKLSIKNSFMIEPGHGRMGDWQCRTSIFEFDRLEDIVDDSQAKESEDVQITSDTEDVCLIHIAFESTYWVRKVHNLMCRLQSASKEAAQNEGIEARKTLRKVEEEIRSDIKNTTVIKEIFIADSATGRRKRVMIIYWQFKQTQHRDEIGITTWRTLLPPQAGKRDNKTMNLPNMEDNVMRPDFDFNTPLGMVNAAGIRVHQSLVMPSQHELEVLSSAALFDPSLYSFAGIHAHTASSYQEGQVDMVDYTMAGAGMHEAMDYGESMTFDITMRGSIDPAITTATFENPLHAYDPSVLDGSAHTPTQLLPHINQTHHHKEETYVLVHPMQAYEPETSQQTPETCSQESDSAQQHQYMQIDLSQRFNCHNHYSINGLFGDMIEGTWPLTQLQEHQQQLQPQHLARTISPNLHPIYQTHIALQEAQTADRCTQVDAKRNVEDWEIDLLDEFDTAGQSSVATMETTSGRTLLPSAFEE